MTKATVLVALALVSIWIVMVAGLTSLLTEDARLTGVVMLATAIVASLLVLYFDWRGRMMRRLRAEPEAHEDLDRRMKIGSAAQSRLRHRDVWPDVPGRDPRLSRGRRPAIQARTRPPTDGQRRGSCTRPTLRGWHSLGPAEPRVSMLRACDPSAHPWRQCRAGAVVEGFGARRDVRRTRTRPRQRHTMAR